MRNAATCKQIMIPVQTMAYHPKWVPKYREIYKPTYFDTVQRRWDSGIKVHSKTFRTQDPLFFDHDCEATNGGIQLLIEHMHDKGSYNVPLKNQAYLLYNMTFKDIFDPLIY